MLGYGSMYSCGYDWWVDPESLCVYSDTPLSVSHFAGLPTIWRGSPFISAARHAARHAAEDRCSGTNVLGLY